MKLHALFASTYGWCPQARGLSRGEMELGLMANLSKMKAMESLGHTQGIAAAFNGDAMANLAEQAGLPEREVIKIKMESFKDEMNMNRGNQWQ